MRVLITNNLTGKTDEQDVVVDKTPIMQPIIKPTETELLQAEIISLKARLAKIEAVPLVKTALEPIAIVK